jgi:hypothetical protein
LFSYEHSYEQNYGCNWRVLEITSFPHYWLHKVVIVEKQIMSSLEKIFLNFCAKQTVFQGSSLAPIRSETSSVNVPASCRLKVFAICV